MVDQDNKREDEWFLRNEKQLLDAAHCEGIFFDAGELEQILTQKDDQRRGFFRKLVKI